MKVYIVIVNGNVDSVFLHREDAEHHKTFKAKQWSIVTIIEKTVYEF